MLTKKILVITVDEARRGLALHIAEMYKNPAHTLNDIVGDLTEGRSWDFSEKKMPQKEVIDLFAEWEVGKKLAAEHNADQVAVETGEPSMGYTGDKYEIVYDTNVVAWMASRELAAQAVAAADAQPEGAEVH